MTFSNISIVVGLTAAIMGILTGLLALFTVIHRQGRLEGIITSDLNHLKSSVDTLWTHVDHMKEDKLSRVEHDRGCKQK